MHGCCLLRSCSPVLKKMTREKSHVPLHGCVPLTTHSSAAPAAFASGCLGSPWQKGLSTSHPRMPFASDVPINVRLKYLTWLHRC